MTTTPSPWTCLKSEPQGSIGLFEHEWKVTSRDVSDLVRLVGKINALLGP